MVVSVDHALAWTERRGIGIVDQRKLQLVDVHPFDDILERLAIPFIAKRVVIAFDENDPSVQPLAKIVKVTRKATFRPAISYGLTEYGLAGTKYRGVFQSVITLNDLFRVT